MTNIFGVYNIRSRISVALVLLAPILFQGYMFIPELRSLSSTFIVTLITFALSNLVIVTSRINGGKALHKCFPNGLPAQQFLLPENQTLDKITQARYYDFFKQHLNNFQVSTNASEMKIQSESAIKWLIARTRNTTDFPLIAEENTNLGFAYNLLGIPLLILSFWGNLNLNHASVLFCFIFTVLYLLMWILVITKKLVINCAKKYAFALLSACDSDLLI